MPIHDHSEPGQSWNDRDNTCDWTFWEYELPRCTEAATYEFAYFGPDDDPTFVQTCHAHGARLSEELEAEGIQYARRENPTRLHRHLYPDMYPKEGSA